MEQTKKHIGLKIKDLQLRHGYTVRGLAAALNMDYSYLSRIQNGKGPTPSLDMLEKIGGFFGVKLSYFFGEEQELTDELKEYVDWISFADDMKEKNLTPEDIKEIIELTSRLKNLSNNIDKNQQ